MALSGDCSWELRGRPWAWPVGGSWRLLLCPGVAEKEEDERDVRLRFRRFIIDFSRVRTNLRRGVTFVA